MNAPEPTFTSSTMASAPPAIFLEMIEPTISGIDRNGRGHVSKRVHLLVGRIDVGALRDDGDADVADLVE